MKKKDRLNPVVQAPTVKPVGQAFKDLGEILRFGSSVDSWRRRSDASRRASLARRRNSKRSRMSLRATIVTISINAVAIFIIVVLL